MVPAGDGDQGMAVLGGDALIGLERDEAVIIAVEEDDGLLQTPSACQTAGSCGRWVVIS